MPLHQQRAALLIGRKGGRSAELGRQMSPVLSVISTIELALLISVFQGISSVDFFSGTGLTDHCITCLLLMGFSVIIRAHHNAKSLCGLPSYKGDLVTAWAPTAPHISCSSPHLT